MGKAFLRLWDSAEPRKESAIEGFGTRAFPAESIKMQKAGPSFRRGIGVLRSIRKASLAEWSEQGGKKQKVRSEAQTGALYLEHSGEALKGFEQESNRI